MFSTDFTSDYKKFLVGFKNTNTIYCATCTKSIPQLNLSELFDDVRDHHSTVIKPPICDFTIWDNSPPFEITEAK